MQNAPCPFVIRRVYNAFAYFLKAETAGGVALFAAALLAIFVANTPGLREWRLDALAMPMGFAMGSGVFTLSVEHIINDGLMAVFFLLVGMEIKREMLAGELSTRAKAVLPAIAAVGGMAAPALIYTAANWGDGVALRGWAIPTATDIAFSLGVLSLTGKRAPLSIKIFLTAIAIIDDLLAIAIIAVFYTESLRAAPLALSALVLYGLFLLNKNGVRALWPYLLGGLGLWGLTLASGLHATLAGVFTAAAIPLARGEENRIHHIADRPVSPLEFLEHNLHLPVTFFILPLFAFVNAGVDFAGLSIGVLAHPIPLGIAFGLVAGKIIGIFGATWIAVKSGFAQMPDGACWRGVFCVSLLCGIGFTVSLFIGRLSFPGDDDSFNLAKLGVLLGSLIAGIAALIAMRIAYPPAARADKQ